MMSVQDSSSPKCLRFSDVFMYGFNFHSISASDWSSVPSFISCTSKINNKLSYNKLNKTSRHLKEIWAGLDNSIKDFFYDSLIPMYSGLPDNEIEKLK